MDSQTRRSLALSSALALALGGVGFVVTPLKAFAWPLFIAASILLLFAYAPEILERIWGPPQAAPKLPRGLVLVLYDTHHYHDQRMPFETALKFQPTRELFPPLRFRVRCNGPVLGATAALDVYEGGKLVTGYSYYDSTKIMSPGEVMVEVSDWTISPDDRFTFSLRSNAPLQIQKVQMLGTKGVEGVGFTVDLGRRK